MTKLKETIRVESFVEILDKDGNVIEKKILTPKKIKLEDLL